jgi:hypothetical protein
MNKAGISSPAAGATTDHSADAGFWRRRRRTTSDVLTRR